MNFSTALLYREKGSSEIVRGIAARFKDFGVEISGFDMYTTSNVLGVCDDQCIAGF